MDKSPFALDANVPTKGGIIGGGLAGANNPTWLFTATGSDTVMHHPTPGPGYVRNLYINLAAAQATSARNDYYLRMDKNKQGTPITLVSAQAAGVYSTPTMMRVERLAEIDLRATAWATAGTTPTGWASEFIMEDGGVYVGAYVATTPTVNTTTYSSLYTANGSGAILASDALAGMPIPFSGTVKNFCVTASNTQDASGSLVATVMVNGSATSITVTVPASRSNNGDTYCDLTNTAAITANQTISIRWLNNATAGSGQVNAVTLEVLPTSGTPGIVGSGKIGAVASGSTNYWRPFNGISNSTEANVQLPMPRAGTMTNFCIQRQTAASIGTTTATIFKNGSASGQLTMTIGNATGVQCATGSVAIAQGDTITMEVKNSVACTGGCPTLGGWAVDF